MSPDDVQKQQITTWLRQGLKLAEIQKRIESEFGLRLTYMEVKLLVSDLEVLPADPATRPAEAPGNSPKPATALGDRQGAIPSRAGDEPGAEELSPRPAAGVNVTVDQLARPGAVVSGGVTFRDGQTATWYVDQMGRIGVVPKDKRYRPSAADMQQFQTTLDQELARQGF